MNSQEAHFKYILRIADNALILGQRLAEWCGHGPILEQDIALTNFSLDYIGQARNLYTYAAAMEGQGKTEDDLAFLRNEHAFYNMLLVEQPNGHWGQTIVRQFLFDVFNYLFHQELCQSKDEQLAAIAAKSLKEITYHLKFSSEWLIRLGDGTEESHAKMQEALDDLWMYTGELCLPDAIDEQMAALGIGVDLAGIQPLYQEKVTQVLKQATLVSPDIPWMQSGGKQGRHTEHLGHLLAEMQYMQRAFPGMEW
ncbi:MAG: phenylacetate-CoA oxygenase subunit PaaC [Saprospiraceae bacterium]|nr:phenylacetate-CoA oxygenase subunit PaaC [Saprospiraceae bacterium]